METTVKNEVETSNDLKHSIYCKDADLNDLKINIRLNDECKNGHQDFSITCDCYKAGKPHIDRYFLYGGCCHEEILKVKPDLKIFVNLHLCDYTGCPMYTSANGLYHLKNGFNNTKPEDEKFEAEYCDYYRITPEQFKVLRTAEDELRFSLLLQSLGILEQWKIKADEAIKLMENWTGKKFVVDSVKTQHAPLTNEQTKMMQEREKEGYYLPENIAARKKTVLDKIRQEQYDNIREERDKDINKANMEYKAKKAVLDFGLSLNNFIFYTHTNIGSFNWKGYEEQITLNQFQEFINSPFAQILAQIDGITWKLDKDK